MAYKFVQGKVIFYCYFLLFFFFFFPLFSSNKVLEACLICFGSIIGLLKQNNI